MKRLMKRLEGKKTILGSIALGVLVIAHALKLVDTEMAQYIAGVLLAWTGVSMSLHTRK